MSRINSSQRQYQRIKKENIAVVGYTRPTYVNLYWQSNVVLVLLRRNQWRIQRLRGSVVEVQNQNQRWVPVSVTVREPPEM